MTSVQHVSKLEEVRLDKPALVSIGVFDGVHLGHQALIKKLVEEAAAQDKQAVVLTFHPHPDIVLGDIQDRYYLTSPEQRAEYLGALGVDVVITHPFDESVREIRAVEFVDNLVNHVKMSGLWVGRDFALGYQREGNIDFLSLQGAEKDFNVTPIDLLSLEHAEKRISSSQIRQLLQSGEVTTAKTLLGRPYTVRGQVVEGDKRGRTIGFPTANTAIWDKQVVPLNGVYAGWVTVQGERFMAVANVGIRPTFDGTSLTVEPYLLGFNRNIYGETLELAFEKRLRGEQKFSGIDALKTQLQQDIEQGRNYLVGLS
jgi:riboflavin kinase/FMN adenylyltransferase